jgi:hypothetical protein
MAMPIHAYLHILLLRLVFQFCIRHHVAAHVNEKQVLLQIKSMWSSPTALVSWYLTSSNASSHCSWALHLLRQRRPSDLPLPPEHHRLWPRP